MLFCNRTMNDSVRLTVSSVVLKPLIIQRLNRRFKLFLPDSTFFQFIQRTKKKNPEFRDAPFTSSPPPPFYFPSRTIPESREKLLSVQSPRWAESLTEKRQEPDGCCVCFHSHATDDKTRDGVQVTKSAGQSAAARQLRSRISPDPVSRWFVWGRWPWRRRSCDCFASDAVCMPPVLRPGVEAEENSLHQQWDFTLPRAVRIN